MAVTTRRKRKKNSSETSEADKKLHSFCSFAGTVVIKRTPAGRAAASLPGFVLQLFRFFSKYPLTFILFFVTLYLENLLNRYKREN